MININKLKGKIVEKGLSVEKVAVKIGIDKSTFYRKLNSGGQNITIKEANLLMRILDLSTDEAISIFFSQPVACDANSANS